MYLTKWLVSVCLNECSIGSKEKERKKLLWALKESQKAFLCFFFLLSITLILLFCVGEPGYNITMIHLTLGVFFSRYTTGESMVCMRQKRRLIRKCKFWLSVETEVRDDCQASSLTVSIVSLSESLITKEKGLLAKARHLRHLREVCMSFGPKKNKKKLVL